MTKIKISLEQTVDLEHWFRQYNRHIDKLQS